ncbi:MAG: universal stress protein [Nitrososphaerota archaeon]|jgi:nucleotide-binding universal stress UspA family protein|nr:universal stress protein [Nitrososphaerota archaeon]MCL5671979.1 universal stress protein [Nitrososphaerota archaeon]MDG6912673.1 universal stress protein [Nitrososphaerota archaeon]MDG6937021.1 universal stress protein [Nitrososphaerota archaeon]MDG6958877.1 universal stress protein [Nitrososphaerota archaeon]
MPELTGGRALLRKLLLGYDGSAQSERALALAVEIASQNEVSVIHIAYVVRKPAGAPDPVPDELVESLKRSAAETLLNAERTVKKGLLDAASHIEVGDPGEKLLELASALKPDLVVLGALQHSASEKLVGTTSSHFLKSRPYSLLIVP